MFEKISSLDYITFYKCNEGVRLKDFQLYIKSNEPGTLRLPCPGDKQLFFIPDFNSKKKLVILQVIGFDFFIDITSAVNANVYSIFDEKMIRKIDAWGGKNVKHLYAFICDSNIVYFETVETVKNKEIVNGWIIGVFGFNEVQLFKIPRILEKREE